uniref:Uncharacterized protein n=2 Tax=Oryza sativa subsp. japonica TaxID=39947 RepID=Q10B54_ORYSJ|nr:hypothetical protein [Oryza sativa Japonica Group]ABF99691.1 Protein of unknown function, DUF614 containing protein [Oryza sativa Japonica Group]
MQPDKPTAGPAPGVPVGSAPWSSGLCDCFDDYGLCTYVLAAAARASGHTIPWQACIGRDERSQPLKGPVRRLHDMVVSVHHVREGGGDRGQGVDVVRPQRRALRVSGRDHRVPVDVPAPTAARCAPSTASPASPAATAASTAGASHARSSRSTGSSPRAATTPSLGGTSTWSAAPPPPPRPPCNTWDAS